MNFAHPIYSSATLLTHTHTHTHTHKCTRKCTHKYIFPTDHGKDFPDSSKLSLRDILINILGRFPKNDLPTHWEGGPEQGHQIMKVVCAFLHFTVVSLSFESHAHSHIHSHPHSPRQLWMRSTTHSRAHMSLYLLALFFACPTSLHSLPHSVLGCI